MASYTLYIKKHVKEAFVKKDAGYKEALRFLEYQDYGLVKDVFGNKYFTREELENAESIRSDDRVEFDNTTTSGTLPVFVTTLPDQ